jgi:ABC-2 type transport system permease protein
MAFRNLLYFLLQVLLVWNLFTAALSGATASVVNNAGIVKKVYFPREILPLASVGAAIVHYLLQLMCSSCYVICFPT